MKIVILASFTIVIVVAFFVVVAAFLVVVMVVSTTQRSFSPYPAELACDFFALGSRTKPPSVSQGQS